MGNVTDYYPYGKVLRMLQFDPQRHRLQGNQHDNETGLEYFNARNLESDLAFFRSVDPVFHAGQTPYSSHDGNPILFVDPAGTNVGEYYKDGIWVRSDGKDDGKVYHADEDGDVIFGTGILKDTKFKEWTYDIEDQNFGDYLPTLLEHEGGNVNHSSDPGGATNKGVTFKTFKKYANDLLGVEPNLTNLKRLTDSQAAAIYEHGYWKPSRAGSIDDAQVGQQYFDTYVNGGGRNVLGRTTGVFGQSRSIANLNSLINDYGGENIHYIYRCERMCRYDDLIEANPALEAFRRGWRRRVESFEYETP